MEMFKKRNVQIITGIIILVLIAGGFYVAGNTKQKPVEEVVDQNIVQILTPKDIGLSLEASPDNKKVRFTVAKASDIKAIEYELTYEADSTAQERSEGSDERVQRGITGDAEIDGESSYESEWLVLGSQSANVVRYDTGIESISITLKITKKSGKIYQVKDKLEFESTQ